MIATKESSHASHESKKRRLNRFVVAAARHRSLRAVVANIYFLAQAAVLVLSALRSFHPVETL
jgi:hypothetical protein